MEMLSHEKVSDRLIRIKEITGVYMYLVIGEEKALLIDTGCGLGNLEDYVRSLTKLPLTVVCTHGHMDHAGGAAQFEQVFLNPADVELTFSHCTVENRKEYAALSVAALHPGMDGRQAFEWEYHPVRREPYEPLYDGMEFDLGGITVRAMQLTGHTQGCMCMLLCEERRILLGDACNPSVFLFDKETLSVEEYLEELQKFSEKKDLYDKVLFSHGDTDLVSAGILADCMEVCKEILEGRDEKVIFSFMGGTYRAAHAILPNQMRKDGGTANIIYNADHIRRQKVEVR